MNHNSLKHHYIILKTIKELGHIIYLSDSKVIDYNMKWDIAETYTNKYVLLFKKKSFSLQLVRINNEQQYGYTIARLSLESNSMYSEPNKIYRGGAGFLFTGYENTIQYRDNCKEEVFNIEALPQAAMMGLLSDEGIEELEFQYSTLYEFEGESFEMYCIFSLLCNLDDICSEVKGNKVNRLSFLDVIGDDEVLESLVHSLTSLKDKLEQDISHD